MNDYELDPPIIDRLKAERQRLWDQNEEPDGETSCDPWEVVDAAVARLTPTERDELLRSLFEAGLELLEALEAITWVQKLPGRDGTTLIRDPETLEWIDEKTGKRYRSLRDYKDAT